MARNLFERLDAGRPPLTEKRTGPPPIEKATKQAYKINHAQTLLAWLQRRNKSTISIREIRLYGPHSVRKREIATESVETLTKHGWLIPVETHRSNWRHWQIVRNEPIIHSVESNVATNVA
jgi:hypothetical protein